MGVLGNGSNVAWIYDKNGTMPIAPVENAAGLNWGRRLNAISEASVQVMTGQHGDCCSIFGNIATWGHSLVMFRDGVRSWEGPITNIKWTRGGVNISAHDVLGWAIKRVTDAAILHPEPGFRAVDEIYDDIGRVFAAHDPNVLAHLLRLGSGTGPLVTRDVKAYGGYYDDQLNEMVKGGANFTTVGRRIVVWPNSTIIGRVAPLLPASHMTGEVEIEEDGFALAAWAAAVNDEGLAGGSAVGGVDTFYGQVETLVSAAETGTTSLAATATAWREAHYPAPLLVNVPAGSVLSCEAPYAMEELVAGTIVPVKLDEGLCRRVEATQQLSAVEVTDGPSGERVAITVTPVSGVLT